MPDLRTELDELLRIPSISTGAAIPLPEDAIHAPNESYRLESLRLGERAARELYLSLGTLSR